MENSEVFLEGQTHGDLKTMVKLYREKENLFLKKYIWGACVKSHKLGIFYE